MSFRQGNDAQNYMWLIRSAGQKRDVPKALALLRQLQGQVPPLSLPFFMVFEGFSGLCMVFGALFELFELVRRLFSRWAKWTRRSTTACWTCA